MGKAALDYKRGNMFFVPPDEIFVPGVDGEDGHYMKDVDPVRHGIDLKFVKNIKAEGIIQPIVVTKEGNRVTVVVGRRRVLHGRVASKELAEEGKEPLFIPCIVKRGGDKELFGVYVSENENRMDDNPVTKARKAEKLRAYGYSADDIAVKFGVGTQTVHMWEKALDLDFRVLDFVEKQQLPLSAALLFCDLPLEEQYTKAKAAIEESASNGKRPTKKQVERQVNPDAIQAPKKTIIKALAAERPDGLSADFLAGVAWARGLIDVEQTQCPALTTWLREQAQKPAKRPAKKNK